jgi:hypothetical protein
MVLDNPGILQGPVLLFLRPDVMKSSTVLCYALGLVWLGLATEIPAAELLSAALETNSPSATTLTLAPSAADIWEQGVGQGFRARTQSAGLGLGAAYGFAAFGGLEQHHFALASLTYGYMLGPTLATNHWFRGNFELRGELFGGAQFYPSTEWIIGLTPHLRYNFATGSRWVPFIDAGAGVTATGIGHPDLSNTFEFNLHGGVGVRWFISHSVTLDCEAALMHLSCAGLSQPNKGVNAILGMLGFTKFF